MADLDVITAIFVAQAVGSLAVAATYSFLRLRKEERKVKASEAAAASSEASAASSKAALDAMVVYHSKRLDIEQEKLELARRNGRSEPPSANIKPEDIFSRVELQTKELAKKYPAWNDTSEDPTAVEGDGQ